MKRKFSVVLAMASLLLVPAAWATEMSVNGGTSLADDYENDAVGSVPVADVGAWDPTTTSTVTDVIAFQGSHSLAVAGSTIALHRLSPMASNPGDVVRLVTMAYVPSVFQTLEDGSTQFAGFNTSGVVGGASNSPMHTGMHSDGTIWYYDGNGPSAAYQPTTTKITFDTWQKWEIEYVVGASTWSWLVDGVGDTGIGLNAFSTDLGIGALQIWSNQSAVGTAICLDAVPEPASLLLLSLAGLACLRRRR